MKAYSKTEAITDYFFALMLVLNCQSIYQNSADINFRIYELTLISAAVSSIFCLLKYGISAANFKKVSVISVIYLSVLFIVYTASVDASASVSFFSRFLSFPLILISFFSNRPQENKLHLLNAFVSIVCMISVISIFFWISGTLFKALKPSGYFLFRWGNINRAESYYNIYFETQFIDWIPALIKRNTAVFVEGPMYALVLVISCVFTIIEDTVLKAKRIKIIILSAAMITTFSVTAYIFLAAYLFFILRKNRFFRKIMLLILPVIAAAAILIFYYKSSTGSFFLRIRDYIIGLKVFADHPLFGVGFGNVSEAVKNNSSVLWDGFSNSFFAVLIQGGIVFILPYIIPILSAVIKAFIKRDSVLLMIAAAYLYLTFTIIFYTAYVNFLIWALMLYMCETGFKEDTLSLFRKRIQPYIRTCSHSL